MTTIELARDAYLLIAVLGLAVSVSLAASPMLAQGAFVGVGAVFTLLLEARGAPLLVAVLGATAMALALGYLLGALLNELSGPAFGVATWAFASLVYLVLLRFPDLSGGEQGLTRPTPTVIDLGEVGLRTAGVHLVVALLLAGLVAAGIARTLNGPGGLDLAALRSPALATSLGVPVVRRRPVVLAVTAACGGLAGAGTAVLLGSAAPADFSPLLSLQLFIAALIASRSWLWGSILGLVVVAAVPHAADGLVSTGLGPEQSEGALTAALLILVLAALPLARRVQGRWSQPRRRHQDILTAARRGGSVDVERVDSGSSIALEAQGVGVSQDGRLLLDQVDIGLRAGEIHALIGPNGSGKSTLLKALSGTRRPQSGHVSVAGDDVAGLDAQELVGRGVVRTSQRTMTIPALAPLRQLELAARGGARGRGSVLRHLVAPRASIGESARAGRQNAFRLLDAIGLAEHAGDDPAALTAGQARLLHVARAMATEAEVLLLDEPAAGMSDHERDLLGDLLQDAARAGAAILLVEHDLRFTARIATRVTVLDHGRRIASGLVAEVLADSRVRLVCSGVPEPDHGRGAVP